MTKYCTLADATNEADTTGDSLTIGDNYFLAAVEAVSRRIDALLQPTQLLSKRPYFAPYIESRAIRYFGHQINSLSGVLEINRYFLELSTVVAGTVSITSDVSPYVDNFPPYSALQLSEASSYSWYNAGCGSADSRPYLKPLTINATWGWHPDWDNSFEQLSTLAAAIVSTTATTFDVAAAQGVLFSPGHFIQVDSEWMEVTNVATDTLTVIRGVNGSTAAAHLINRPVSALTISQDIKRITARQADSMYSRRAAFEDKLFSDGGGVVTYPQDLLQELINTLQAYMVDGV